MKLSRILKKKEFNLRISSDKWNALWDLWANGKADSPCDELMTYISEVNNGGHSQYFINREKTGDLKTEISVLKKHLPFKLWLNLWLSHKAHLCYEKNESGAAEFVLMWCDMVFDLDEADLNRILEKYAEKIDL